MFEFEYATFHLRSTLTHFSPYHTPSLPPLPSLPPNRYSPTTIKFAMALLAKTSTTVYKELAEHFFLPSVRHVEGQTQAQRCEFDGPRQEVIASMADIARERGYEEEDCVGCVSFDAMKMADGVYFHAHTGRLMGLACEELNAHLLIAEFKRRTRYTHVSHTHTHPIPTLTHRPCPLRPVPRCRSRSSSRPLP